MHVRAAHRLETGLVSIAAGRGGTNLYYFQDFRTEDGSSKGQNVAYLVHVRSTAEEATMLTVVECTCALPAHGKAPEGLRPGVTGVAAICLSYY